MPITVSPSGGAAAGSPLPLVDLDCSSNPNYPAAAKGYRIRVTVAGKIGGASGKVVEAGDVVEAVAANAGGTEASVGTSWIVLQANIAGMTAAGLSMITAADATAQAALLTTLMPTADGAFTGVTSAGFRDTSAAFDVALGFTSSVALDAGRALTIDMGNVAHTLALGTTAGTITFPNAADLTVAGLQVANVFTGIQTIMPAINAKALVVTGVTHTANSPIFDLAQTWNNGAVAFTALKLNVTNTASENSSRLIDLQVGGTTRFSVIPTATGCVTEIGAGASSGLGISFASGVVTLGRSNGDGSLDGSTDIASWGTNNNLFAVNNVLSIGRVYASRDLFLARKAAATLQLGEDAAGVTNQMFTAASRITSDGVGANLTIAAGNGRGGAGGSLIFSYYTTAAAATIGTLTTAMSVLTGGQVKLESASLLCFGGITSSFPALRESSGNLEVRFADNSGYTGITAASFNTEGAPGASSGGALTTITSITVVGGIITDIQGS